MGMRELIILIVGLAVVAVILRGLFLALHARRGQIRLAIDKNIPQDVDLDALEMAELPSGGARIVRRSLDEVNRQNSTQDELDLGGNANDSGPIPILMDTVELGGVNVTGGVAEDEPNEDYFTSETADESYASETAEAVGSQDIGNRNARQQTKSGSTGAKYDKSAEDLFDFESPSQARERTEPKLGFEDELEDELENFSMKTGERIGERKGASSKKDTEIYKGFSNSSRQTPGASGKLVNIGRDDSRQDRADSRNRIEEQTRTEAPSRAILKSSGESAVVKDRANNGSEVASLSDAKGARRPVATNATVNTPRQIETAEVLVVNVMSRQGELFYGNDLLQVLLTAGLKHGDMQIFHKQVDSSPGSAIVYSVANILNPGTFELESMDTFSTRGVSLFMSMPAVINNMDAFEQMLKTALQIRGALNGELRDDHRNMITAQTIEHYRQRVHDFEIRRLRSIQAQS